MALHASGGESYVLFMLAGATYALPSDDIVQLDMVSAATPVPNAPPFVDGVVSVRGQVIPVVNLRARFGFPRAPHDVRSRLIVVRGLGRTVGLLVDGAREFAGIAVDDVKPLPEGIAGTSGRYLRGVAQQGERLVLIVNVAELIAGTTEESAETDDIDPDAAPHVAAADAST